MKTIRVMNYEVFLDKEDKEIYQYLHKIFFETKLILNTTIRHTNFWSSGGEEYRRILGIYPKPSDLLKKNDIEFYKSLSGHINNKIRQELNKNNSGNSSMAVQLALNKWQTDNKENKIIKGINSIPQYTKHDKTYLAKKSIKIFKEKDKYYVELSLFSKEAKKEFELKDTKVKFNLKVSDNTRHVIINRILNNEYNIGGSIIQYDKENKKFFLKLAYEFEVKKEFTGKNVMGIDLGINFPVYWAIHDTKIRGNVKGGEIEAFRKQINRRKYLLRRQRGQTSCDGSKGHGRNKFLQAVTKIGEKEANFRKKVNQRIAKRIGDLCIKNDVGLVRLEDLKGITDEEKNNKWLKNWTYYDAKLQIKNVLEKLGIIVEEVDRTYTSQACSVCGHIERDNRKGIKFKCKKCEYETHADYNAALNISNTFFDEIETVKEAREKLKERLKEEKKEKIIEKQDNKNVKTIKKKISKKKTTKKKVDKKEKVNNNNYEQMTLTSIEAMFNCQ